MADMISLKDIVPAAQNNINTQFILLDKVRVTFEGQNKTCLALVADNTAAVHFQLWGDECDAFEPSDIIRLSNGIFSYQRNNLVLRAGKRGKAEKVGEFTMAFVETPNMCEISWVPDPNNSKNFGGRAFRDRLPRLNPKFFPVDEGQHRCKLSKLPLLSPNRERKEEKPKQESLNGTPGYYYFRKTTLAPYEFWNSFFAW